MPFVRISLRKMMQMRRLPSKDHECRQSIELAA